MLPKIDFTISHITIVFIGLYFIVTRTKRFIHKERTQSIVKITTINFIWLIIIIIALFPDFSHRMFSIVGIDKDLNGLYFLGFIFVFILLLRFLSIIEEIEHTITKIVRKEALSELKK